MLFIDLPGTRQLLKSRDSGDSEIAVKTNQKQSIKLDGRKEDWKNGRLYGRKEGRKEERKERRKGRSERQTDREMGEG